jgi:hypothetical protein
MNQIDKKIEFWIENSQNVLFIGRHGVGKTAMVKDAFERRSINYRYFSASTMDPWVDFVGVPKEKIENKVPEQFLILKELSTIDRQLAVDWVVSNWKMSESSASKIVDHAIGREQGLAYLDLIRPLVFATGEIEALFFDEFNRSPKKVRNAVMELLQFKSINGYKFPKLKMIWAAINPDDEDQTYDVERLDPAQKDRFHVSVEVPYSPSVDWFRTRYGQRTADSAIQWWEDLSTEEKGKVSPRRLQYALDTYCCKGDMRDILPSSSNISKLYSSLSSGPILEKLESLMSAKDTDQAKVFLSNENNYASAMKYVLKSDALKDYFLPLVPKEKISSLISENSKTSTYIIGKIDKVSVFKEVCEEILKANTNSSVVKKIRKYFTELQAIKFEDNEGDLINLAQPFYNKKAMSVMWGTTLEKIQKNADLSKLRLGEFQNIVKSIPKLMTGEEAMNCLEILCNMELSPTEVSQGLLDPRDPWANFISIVNHCIVSGVQNRKFSSKEKSWLSNADWVAKLVPTPKDFSSFLVDNSRIFTTLFSAIRLSGNIHKVVRTQEHFNYAIENFYA